MKRRREGYEPSPRIWNNMLERMNQYIQTIPTKRINETLPEWMENEMVVVEGEHRGRWDFRLTPYLRRPAELLSPFSGISELGVIKGNQGGWSTLSFALICFCIKHGIGPGLFVSGDQAMAEDAFEKRLDPLIESSGLSDKIKAVVKKRHDKTTGDRRESKSYGGTFVRAAGPNSESKLRSFPSWINIIEETDVYPMNLKRKGNPIEKIVRRADTFPNKKIYYNSTPKMKSESHIEPIFEQGDKEYYYVPCPKCGYMQVLTWGGFHWEKNEDGSPKIEIDPATGKALNDPVYYECANPECKHHIKNSDKYKILLDEKAGGMVLPDGRRVWAEWRATKKPDRPGLVTMKWPTLYSPFRDWLGIVLQWWRVKDDILLLPDFVNDVLAETWEETMPNPKPDSIMSRAEEWKAGDIPVGVLFLTLAADVQADRIEAGLVGWGKNKEAWVIDYQVFEGVTEEAGSEPWNKLGEMIDKERVRCDGLYLGTPIVSFVDAGFLQAQVNYFCSQYAYSQRSVSGVYPVVGRENLSAMYTAHRNDIETPLLHINDQRLKRELYGYLNRNKPAKGSAVPYGYIHFPCTFGKTFYDQLTAEEIYIEKDKRGKQKIVIDNRHQRRNEVLDVMKMNYGALHYMCLQWFENVNKSRRLRKRREIEIDWAMFWDQWDVSPEDVETE